MVVNNPQAGLFVEALNSAPVESVIVDSEGNIVAVNEAWRQFAGENRGFHAGNWVEENYLSITQDAANQQSMNVEEGIRAVLEGEDERFTHEYPCHSPTEQRWFLLDVAGFKFQSERHALICHHNITEQKLASLEAKAHREQLETLLGVLTHDIRNPLQVIEGYATLLADELEDDDRIEKIHQAIARISEITEASLNFSRTGRLSDIQPTELSQLAQDAWDGVPTEEATLSVTGSIELLCDQRLMYQLFENLFRNSIKHAGRDCAVEIGALSDGFYVEDNGPGIPEVVREKALRGDYSTQGTGGLGLAIVKTVVAAHGGELEIMSAESGGARFEISNLNVTPETRSKVPTPSKGRT